MKFFFDLDRMLIYRNNRCIIYIDLSYNIEKARIYTLDNLDWRTKVKIDLNMILYNWSITLCWRKNSWWSNYKLRIQGIENIIREY